jgi:hypothetical protein
MALSIPTTQATADLNLNNFESNLGQTSPINDKAFLRVLAVLEALNFTTLYKFMVERAKQNLALTATGEDLENIGREYDVIKKPAEATVLSISIPGANGSVIPSTISYIGAPNGVRYFPDSSAIVSGGIAVLDVTAETAGADGNLNIGDTLSISTQVAGVESTATVTAIPNTGANDEDQEVYRTRVLFVIRNPLGGGNASDYKTWAEEVAGVFLAYPFSGKAFGDPSGAFPGDRTIYIQVNEAIQVDGIAPQSILDEVRSTVNNDPETGLSRPPLGLTDSTLYIESIRVTAFNVIISGFSIGSDVIAQAKENIEIELSKYFRTVRNFVDSIDLVSDKNDIITVTSIAEIIQGVISSLGGSATSIIFRVEPQLLNLAIYQMEAGEIGKLNSVTYA